MKTQDRLLTSSALIELGAGLLLLLFPSYMLALVFGLQSNSLAVMVAQVAGVALLALGIACWSARNDAGGPARLGSLRAITVYNGSAGLLLVLFAVTGRASGIVIWLFAVVHLVHAVLFAFTLVGPDAGPATGPRMR
jgi:hypothetical protein